MSKKLRILAGFAAIWLGLMMFMGSMRQQRMRAHANFDRFSTGERFERGAAATEAGTASTAAGDSAETSSTQSSHHAQMRHHRGGHGLFGGLLRLIFLGFLIKFVLKALGKRRGHHDTQHMASQAADDDLSNEIRVGDEINRDEPAPTFDPDEMTVDDLLHAMKRLGIKKLEL